MLKDVLRYIPLEINDDYKLMQCRRRPTHTGAGKGMKNYQCKCSITKKLHVNFKTLVQGQNVMQVRWASRKKLGLVMLIKPQILSLYLIKHVNN